MLLLHITRTHIRRYVTGGRIASTGSLGQSINAYASAAQSFLFNPRYYTTRPRTTLNKEGVSKRLSTKDGMATKKAKKSTLSFKEKNLGSTIASYHADGETRNQTLDEAVDEDSIVNDRTNVMNEEGEDDTLVDDQFDVEGKQDYTDDHDQVAHEVAQHDEVAREAYKDDKSSAREEGDADEDDADEEIEDETHEGETEYTMERPNEHLQYFRIGSLTLPDELRYTISDVLKNVNRKELRGTATDLSKRLRERTVIKIPKDADAILAPPTKQHPTIPYNKAESIAYIAHRMPGVYGCIYRVLDEIAARQPGYSPASMLDFGSGPGTAVWAAASVWTGQIKRVLAVEPSSGMTDEAKKILEGLPVRWQRYLFEGNTENLKYDLVTASYVLSELASSKARRQVVRALWKSVEPGGLLVLVDAGTPLAFRYLRELRSMLLQDGKSDEAIQGALGKPILIAPCPHSHECPMGANSWCHFVQRVERTPLQLAAKQNSTQSFEDEKYTYLVFQKEPINEPMPDTVGEFFDEDNPIFQNGWSRMVRHPLKRGGHVVLDACTPEGELKRVIVSRATGKQMYNEARKTSWGDGFIFDKEKKVHSAHSVFMKGVKKPTPAPVEESTSNSEETETKEKEPEEWTDEITEPELQPHPMFQSKQPAMQPNPVNAQHQDSAKPEGPISWARDVLLGNKPTEPQPSPDQSWLPLPNEGKVDARVRDATRSRKRPKRAKDEDTAALKQIKYRSQREKAIASKLPGLFPKR